jgi:hypothetical protein
MASKCSILCGAMVLTACSTDHQDELAGILASVGFREVTRYARYFVARPGGAA